MVGGGGSQTKKTCVATCLGTALEGCWAVILSQQCVLSLLPQTFFPSRFRDCLCHTLCNFLGAQRNTHTYTPASTHHIHALSGTHTHTHTHTQTEARTPPPVRGRRCKNSSLRFFLRVSWWAWRRRRMRRKGGSITTNCCRCDQVERERERERGRDTYIGQKHLTQQQTWPSKWIREGKEKINFGTKN